MNKIKLSAIVALVLLAFAPAIQAQLIWHYSPTPMHDGGDSFTAIDCYGEVCTVANIAQVDTEPFQWLVFDRSTDGGFTWTEQRPPYFPNANFGTGTMDYYIGKIQQIDSLNTIARADTLGGLGKMIIRTTDGGVTWSQMSVPFAYGITDFNFSDPMTGIVTLGLPNMILTTTDGGNHWQNNIISFGGGTYGYPVSCHSYGDGMFRVWDYFDGPLYTTHDNWKTWDSTSLSVNDVTDSDSNMVISLFNWGNGDTIIAYGAYWSGHSSDGLGAISRTTDGGKSWKAMVAPDAISVIQSMTPIDHDSIFASGSGYNGGPYMLRSIDRGATWQVDTVLLDINYNASASLSMTITGSGNPIAILSPSGVYGFNSVIFVGEQASAGVASSVETAEDISIYPNPATDFVNISYAGTGQQLKIVDILGRELLRAVTPADGTLKLDVSTLPTGLYYVTDGTWRAKFAKE